MDAKSVGSEKIETITLDRLANLARPEGFPPGTRYIPSPLVVGNPDRRIDELEKKLQKVMQQLEQLQKELKKAQPPVLDHGFFPQDGPVVPPVIDRGFGPADEAGRDRFRKPTTPAPVVPGGKPLQP
jgi:hypothetical protein